MNIALEKTEEYVNGQLRRSYGDAFVRGNNGMPFRTHHGVDFARLTEDSTLHFGAIITELVSIDEDHSYRRIYRQRDESRIEPRRRGRIVMGLNNNTRAWRMALDSIATTSQAIQRA